MRPTQLATLEAIARISYALCVSLSSMNSRLRILERDGYVDHGVGGVWSLTRFGRDLVDARKGLEQE